LRQVDFAVDDLVGWPEDKVVSALGPPDTRRAGALWPPPADATDRSGTPLTGCLTVTDEGEILDLHPFGIRPRHLHLPVAYEEWRYEDVQGSTWVLYLTHLGVTTSDPPLSWASLPTAPHREHPLWRRMIGLPTPRPITHPMSTGRYISPAVLTAIHPLAVAEAAAYQAGELY
jgi:hypothetical protein